MSRFLHGVSLNTWILAITPLFFVGFCLMVCWVYRRSGRSGYEMASKLPLDLQNGGHANG